MSYHKSNYNLKTFPQGGVHPEDRKYSAHHPVEFAGLPKMVYLPLSQHIGAPATAIVKVGDEVKVGQVLAEATGFVSAPVHSSVSGKVTKIDDIVDISGYRKPAIFIKVEGDVWLETIDRSPDLKIDCNLSPEEIIKKIQEAGIVGLGGATFPTHVKLGVPPGKNPPVILLINGVECEPYLTSDHQVMLERAKEIIVGVKILMKAINVSEAKIGIEANKMDAIDALQKNCHKKDGISVHPLKMLYPQGGERQLVKSLVGKEIPPPPAGLPIDVGAVVVNVTTVLSVYEAVQKNKPLIERVVTLTGKGLQCPGNFLTRFGTPVQHLIDKIGGLPEDTGKITAGGPMMGKSFIDLDAPVTKGVSGIVFYTMAESRRPDLVNCIRCGKCVTVCPLGLEPYLIGALVERGSLDRAEAERITNCCECACCAFVCPSNRPLLDYMKLGKARVMQLIRQRAKK